MCVRRITTKAPLYTPDKGQLFQLFQISNNAAGRTHKSISGQPFQPLHRLALTEARSGPGQTKSPARLPGLGVA